MHNATHEDNVGRLRNYFILLATSGHARALPSEPENSYKSFSFATPTEIIHTCTDGLNRRCNLSHLSTQSVCMGFLDFIPRKKMVPLNKP